jgi:photosystem II stability/assembly factor-like uncharacterized protein
MKNLRLSLVLLSLLLLAPDHVQKTDRMTESGIRESGAGHALDMWAFSRMYPGDVLDVGPLSQAFADARVQAQIRDEPVREWEAIGPKNIGGRALALAFHPMDSNVIYVGTASGGLWRSDSLGKGADAWDRVPLGFPAYSISAIAIDPSNPDIMFLGTGEVYSQFMNSRPGTINRFTRGTYGIGILKTVDGGETWNHSLDWSLSNLRGVQDIVINPKNPRSLFAATSIGLYKSVDGGKSWSNVHSLPMAVSIVIHPSDTNLVFVTHGSLDPNLTFSTGVYRSRNGGSLFSKVLNGLPDRYSGKGMLAISTQNPDIIYASLQAWSLPGEMLNSPWGLYKSIDAGESWFRINDRNVGKWQGWYSHDVDINPTDPNEIVYGGIEVYRSTNGGAGLVQISANGPLPLGQVPAGEQESVPDYVHSDIHQIRYSPFDEHQVFIACDGGVFASEDGGETWLGRNGGLQTAQFYANFSNSTTDPHFAMGGMQDNWTAIYTGSGDWTRVLGGDGMNTAIHPLDDRIVFGSAQFLHVYKSVNRGDSFNLVMDPAQPPVNLGGVAFTGPFEMAPSDPDILYAGGQHLFKSSNGGDSWQAVNNISVDRNNLIHTIAVGSDPNLIYVGTAPDPFSGNQSPRILRSTNGGFTWRHMSGHPNRIPTDIAIHPFDDQIIYATFAGIRAAQVIRSRDGGLNWDPLENGMPDVPANSVVIDPLNPMDIYVGNDLGVHYSPDEGDSWQHYSADLPDALMAMHLSISPANRKLRVATHGNGVYQTDLAHQTATGTHRSGGFPKLVVYPNPVNDFVHFKWEQPISGEMTWTLYNMNGQQIIIKEIPGNYFQIDLRDLEAGLYAWTSKLGRELTGSGSLIKH